MITRIVKAKLKAENLAAFKRFMEQFASEIKTMENLHHMDFFPDNDEPLHFHIYTIWKNQTALNKFIKSDINLQFKHNLTEWCSTPFSAWTVENI